MHYREKSGLTYQVKNFSPFVKNIEPKVVKEFFMGHQFPPSDALRSGFVNRLVPKF